jgi:N-formylglutamate amidohydrolase
MSCNRIFSLTKPLHWQVPLIFNSPHSGRNYASDFLKSSRLPLKFLRKAEDAYVDEIFTHVSELGAPLLRAEFPRSYLDLNREPYELDPKMFKSQLPPFANTNSSKVAAGLGTIARLIGEGEEIYKYRLNVAEAMDRIKNLYHPYHSMLCRLLDSCVELFGHAVLLDCHSMPSRHKGKENPDFVLGNRFSTTCSAHLADFFYHRLRRAGYSVAMNTPYAGGYITRHYGQPKKGVQCLQIEINRKLYLNEYTHEKKPTFAELVGNLKEINAQLADELSGTKTQPDRPNIP